MNRSRSAPAFTLIELLVVVAIIALLISILLPSLSQARNVARMVKCASIQKQFGTAHHMYANESDDWFVPHSLNGTSLPWYQNIKFRANLSLPAGNTYPDGLVCPNVPETHRGSAGKNYGGNGHTDSTGVNMIIADTAARFNQGDYSTTSTTTGTGAGRRHFRSKVKNPTGKLQMTDGSDWNLSKSRSEHRLYWDVTPEQDGSANAIWGGGTYNQTSYRHNEGTNILMFDGHVEYLEKAPMWTNRNNLWDLFR